VLTVLTMHVPLLLLIAAASSAVLTALPTSARGGESGLCFSERAARLDAGLEPATRVICHRALPDARTDVALLYERGGFGLSQLELTDSSGALQLTINCNPEIGDEPSCSIEGPAIFERLRGFANEGNYDVAWFEIDVGSGWSLEFSIGTRPLIEGVDAGHLRQGEFGVVFYPDGQ
jgi:hypothetical protein